MIVRIQCHSLGLSRLFPSLLALSSGRLSPHDHRVAASSTSQAS